MEIYLPFQINFTFCSRNTCVFVRSRRKSKLSHALQRWTSYKSMFPQNSSKLHWFYPRKIRSLRLLLDTCMRTAFRGSTPLLCLTSARTTKTTFGPRGFLHWPKHVTGHHLPSHFYHMTLLNDAPEKPLGGKKSLSCEEGKGQQYHGTVVKEAKMRWNYVGDKTDKKEMTRETTKKILKIIRMKAKQRAAQGVTSLCEATFLHFETGPLHI